MEDDNGAKVVADPSDYMVMSIVDVHYYPTYHTSIFYTKSYAAAEAVAEAAMCSNLIATALL
jgi:hypothetical protein